jgi:two-component system OmpR family sensor kinase
LRYSAQGTRIDITATVNTQHMLLVMVSDRRPGVPAAEVETIFGPFYRGAASREVGGYGEDLTIAKRVAESHGGADCARNSIDGSLCADIIFLDRKPNASGPQVFVSREFAQA